MRGLAVSAVIVMAWLSVATGHLPCDSVLRRLPLFSFLFTHCECLYSEWTEWAATNRTAVPTSQCPSGSALIRERGQTVIFGDCDDIIETDTICEPGIRDRLILAFELCSTVQGFGPDDPHMPLLPASPRDNAEQVCHEFTEPYFRRSVREEKKRPYYYYMDRHHSTAEPEPLPLDPTPFDMLEHGGQYRRQSQCDHRHILFVLDTSSSIGMANFNRVTSLLGQLIPLFCKQIKIAVMTFDHEYFIEFCFDEFPNTGLGRVKACEAVSSIPYVREGQGEGTRYTHTAGAAQCVCDYMLSSACGLGVAAGCIDVVFVTDGRANDPSRDVCSEIKCLHNRRGVNTFVIGIGNLNQLKIDCMINKKTLALDEYHLFNFPTFAEMECEFHEVFDLLVTSDTYTCTGSQCEYSEWTEWAATNRTAVPTSQCPSGSALIRERKQVVISGECNNITETNTTCEPEVIDRLIFTLGLGSSGQDISPGDPIVPFNCSSTFRSRAPHKPSLQTSPRDEAEQVCHEFTEPRSRRSIREERKQPYTNSHYSTAEPASLQTNPTPFNMLEHGRQYRRQSQCDYRHILFVLDTSGSIGKVNFDRVTSLLGQLTPLFCKPSQIAVMTFDHEYFVEFCFNEFNNTELGRVRAGEAIRAIPYIREGQGPGTRYTHTAGAALCACEHMLTPTCGLSPAAGCIDVVFITDGHANDQTRDVCSTVDCLHSRSGVNTYAIGIGNIDQLQLDCMIETDLPLDEYHLFNFPTFRDLERELKKALNLLGTTTADSTYTCHDTSVGSPVGRSFSHLLTHCQCLYSEWTDWVTTSRTPVPTSQCACGGALARERRQRVISGECDDIIETNTTCELTMMDRLILTLGLGSSGQAIDPKVRHNVSLFTSRRIARAPSTPIPLRAQVCQDYTVPHSRRSVQDEREGLHVSTYQSTAEHEQPTVDPAPELLPTHPAPELLPTDPSPEILPTHPAPPTDPNILEHNRRYRRQEKSQCDYQHILFVLDTSGSIGITNFNKITFLLSQLTPLFCKPIKIAVMTFNHEYFAEFCFDEFDNTDLGRKKAGEAINSIPYVPESLASGPRWTHTAGAALCACDYMLTPTCGLNMSAGCIDVVFITDGHANDPTLDVCYTVDCLHNRSGVNTYAIGIGNLNQLKLDCMIETDLAPDEYHLFNFLTFDNLEHEFQEAVELLVAGDPKYECVNTETNPAMTSC